MSKYNTAYINVDETALRRESLHCVDADGIVRKGDGVNDILALFVHGYTLQHRAPWGIWVRENGFPVSIRAKAHRKPNGFLKDLVEEMNEKYKKTCVVSLNDKYLR